MKFSFKEISAKAVLLQGYCEFSFYLNGALKTHLGLQFNSLEGNKRLYCGVVGNRNMSTKTFHFQAWRKIFALSLCEENLGRRIFFIQIFFISNTQHAFLMAYLASSIQARSRLGERTGKYLFTNFDII